MCEFRVGDWITISKGKAWKATEFDVAHLKLDNDVELWQPKEGEWCWIGKNLSKIVAHDRDGYFTCLTSNGTYTAYMKLEYIYKIAEPFIGELPSFLKDSQCGL